MRIKNECVSKKNCQKPFRLWPVLKYYNWCCGRWWGIKTALIVKFAVDIFMFHDYKLI